MITKNNQFVNKNIGSSFDITRARVGGQALSLFCLLFCFLSRRPAEKFWGRSQADGRKGRGLGGRNFCPPASVPVPFEKRKSGRRFRGNSAFPLRNQIKAFAQAEDKETFLISSFI